MTTITIELPDHLVPLVQNIGDRLSLVLELGLSRYAPVSTQAYREAIDFLTQSPSNLAVADFRFSDDIEARINNLLAKNKAEQLSKAEEIELERLSQLEERLQLIKATAAVNLKQA